MRLSRLLYSFHPIRLVATVFSSFRLSLPGIAAALSGLLVLAIPLFLLAFALPLFEGGASFAQVLFSYDSHTGIVQPANDYDGTLQTM